MNSNVLKKLLAQTYNDTLDAVFAEIEVDWLEDPVPFRVFVESPLHMGFPAFSERQYEVAEYMLGTDTKNIFGNLNTLAVLLYGKGAGKDTLASMITLYIVYWLLCQRNPQRYFGLPDGEAIDILNVAANAEQAATIYFDKFKQRVIRWQWLKDRGYSVRLSGVYLSQIKLDKGEFIDNAVTVTKNGVMFPHNIRAFSGHSQEQTMEGKNLLMWTLDEADAFDTDPTTDHAQKLYDVLRSSAVSRFGTRWKGFIISYPRYNSSFTMRMLNIAEGELHWYSDRGATWDIKPHKFFKYYPEKYFEFEGYKVPLEYEEEFRLDPTDAKGKYLTIPPEVEQAFIEHPDKVEQCIDFGRPPIAVLEDYIDVNEVKKKISYFNDKNVASDYIVTVDLGLKSDSAGFSIFHKELREDGDYFVQDLVTSWIPDKEQSLIVSLTNIEEILRTLKDHINISGVFFDQWNSALLNQRLLASGFSSDVYRLNFQDYKNFKDRLYSGRIRLLEHTAQTLEIKRLVLLTGGKVDHPVGGSKDICDTIVGAIKVLAEGYGTTGTINAQGGELITSNIAGMGGSFIS